MEYEEDTHPIPRKEKRLAATLKGHEHELWAAFFRSAAHKLPGAKGRLRENAVARFLQTWIPNRYRVLTNVFPTDPKLGELHTEIDLVLIDIHEGVQWVLDGDGENSIVTWSDVKMVVEVKSILGEKEFDDAYKAIGKVRKYGGETTPPCVLFAFKLSEKYRLNFIERLLDGCSDFPFDAIFILDEGAWFANKWSELRVGIERGLTPTQVQNDGPSNDKLILEFCMDSKYYPHFRPCGDKTPEQTLLALLVFASYATAGETLTKTLLSALEWASYTPIWQDELPETSLD